MQVLFDLLQMVCNHCISDAILPQPWVGGPVHVKSWILDVRRLQIYSQEDFQFWFCQTEVDLASIQYSAYTFD